MEDPKYTYPTAFENTFWSVLDGDFYVSTIGSDVTGDGSPKKPFLTINRAMEIASSEDKIVIGPDEYIFESGSDSGPSGAKEPCRVATKTNINLLAGGLVTVDTITTQVNDRVLVWNQNVAAENGIYVVRSTGPWERADDFDSPANMRKGAIVAILEGPTYQNIIFQFTTTEDITVETTGLNFKQISSPDHDFLKLEDAESTFIVKDLPGFQQPDSTLALWYNNDQATHENLGLFYPPPYLTNLAPSGWRIPTKSEIDGVFSELNLPLNGRYNKGNAQPFENLDSWGNYWFFADDGTTPESLYFNQSLSTIGWYQPNYGNDLRLPTRFIYEGNDDGRGLSNFDVVSVIIEGIAYDTQRLSDGKIYLMQNYRGSLLDYPRRLALSKDKNLSWEIDDPKPHKHDLEDISGLNYLDLRKDVSNFLPSVSKRYINAFEEDGTTLLAKLYTAKAIEEIVPEGWSIPTLDDWNDLLTAANGGVFQTSSNNDIKDINVWNEISPGGSLGIDIDTRGGAFMLNNAGTVNYWDVNNLQKELIINKDVKHSTFWPYFMTRCYYMAQRGSIPNVNSDRIGLIVMGNTGLYSDYTWFYSNLIPDTSGQETFLKIRLVKNDTNDPGTVNFGGTKTYNTVTINGKVWLAEDFEEETLPEESKSLVKSNGELNWSDLDLSNQYQAINTLSSEEALTQTIDFSQASFQPKTHSGSLNITSIINPALGSIIIPIVGGTEVTLDAALITSDNIRGSFDSNKSTNFLKITCYDNVTPSFFASWVLESSGIGQTALEELEIQKSSSEAVTDTESDVTGFDTGTAIDSAGSSISYNATTGVFTLAANKQYSVSINANYRATANATRSTIDLRLMVDGNNVWESYAYIREVSDKSSVSFIKKVVVGSSPVDIKFTTLLSKSGSMTIEMISALVKITVVG